MVIKNYDVLADSERGPQITTHLNTCAVQFHIDPKYKESTQILTNFVKHNLLRIQNEGKVDITLESAYLKSKENTLINLQAQKAAQVAKEYEQNEYIQHEMKTAAASSTGVSRKNSRPMTASSNPPKSFTK